MLFYLTDKVHLTIKFLKNILHLKYTDKSYYFLSNSCVEAQIYHARKNVQNDGGKQKNNSSIRNRGTRRTRQKYQHKHAVI